jgi:outer membrane protein
MRNSFRILIAALIITLPSLSFAQTTFRFGHVNSQEILQVMPERDSADVKMQKFGKELQDTYEGINVEFNTKYQKYLQEEKTLTDLVKKTRMEEIQSYQERLNQFRENAQQEIQKKQAELMQPISEKIKKAISDVGKENSFIYIFEMAPGTSVLYNSPESVDVTSLVKAKLGIKK